MRAALVIGLLTLAAHGMAQNFFLKIWDKDFGGTSHDVLMNMERLSGGTYLLSGWSSSPISGDKTQALWGNDADFSDYWIIKMSQNGDKLWDKRYGGIEDEIMVQARQLNNGDMLLSGQSSSGIGGDKTESKRGSYDYWLVKTDSMGTKLWDKRFGGLGLETLRDMELTPEGGCLLGGYSNSNAGGDKSQNNWPSDWNEDFWVVKVDSLGNKIWDRRYGGNGEDQLTDIMPIAGGGYFLCGYSNSRIGGNKTEDCWDTTFSKKPDFWMLRIDEDGNVLWDKRYGGPGFDAINRVITCPDSQSYLIVGQAEPGITADKGDSNGGTWLVKIETNGNKLWEKAYYQMSGAFSVFYEEDEHIMLFGLSTFGQGGIKSEDNLGLHQIWCLNVDKNGNKNWDKTILLPDDLYRGQACLSVTKGCYVVGTSTRLGTGGNNSNTNWDPTNQTDDFWVMEFCMQPVGIEELTTQASVQVYPNPFARDISISLQKQGLGKATFTIANATGQVIYHSVEANLADSYTKMLDLGNLPGGNYFITIETDGERITRQVAKQ